MFSFAAPAQLGKWLVIFCDEINLPDEDKYGTQRVLSFLRQCLEHGGFYRAADHAWVRLERIQFVGACNPPTDPGRKPLSHRFLRHVPLVYVDYPGELSLKQIYGTFNRAMLKMHPALRAYPEPLTNAMVEFYLLSQVGESESAWSRIYMKFNLDLYELDLYGLNLYLYELNLYGIGSISI